MLTGTKFCQLLLGMDRIVRGVQQNGALGPLETFNVSKSDRDAEKDSSGVLGAFLEAGGVYTEFIGSQLVDISSLGLTFIVNLIAIFTGKGSSKSFGAFFASALDLAQAWVRYSAAQWAEMFNMILAFIPNPIHGVVKLLFGAGCEAIQWGLHAIVGLIDGSASIFHVDMKNPFTTSDCLNTPSTTNRFPINRDDDIPPGERRLLSSLDDIDESKYDYWRQNLDWNGTTFCAELGKSQNPPETHEGFLLWKDCLANRMLVRHVRTKFGNTEIPFSFFDDWTQPVYFFARAARAMIAVIGGDAEDTEFLRRQAYPVKTARSITDGSKQLIGNAWMRFDTESVRKEWLPFLFRDMKTDTNSSGARIDRILKAWQNLPSTNVTAKHLTDVYNSLENVAGTMSIEILPNHTQLRPPISVVTRTRRRLQESLNLNLPLHTSGGLAMPANVYPKIGQYECEKDTLLGLCLNCKFLTMFLDSTIEMIIATGEFYKERFLVTANEFATASRSNQNSTFPSIPSNTGPATNSREYNNSDPGPQPGLPGTSGPCQRYASSGNAIEPNPCNEEDCPEDPPRCQPGPAPSPYINPPQSTSASTAHNLDLTLSNSTHAKNTFASFFTSKDCSLKLSVVGKPLICWFEQYLKPCNYKEVTYGSCDNPNHSIGASFGMVGKVIVGQILWTQFTTISLPFVLMIWVYMFVFFGMRYGYVLRCAPLVPGCFMRDMQQTLKDLAPECFCQVFSAHLAPDQELMCTPGVCDTQNPPSFQYTGCPVTDLGYSWAFFFFLRWQYPHILSFLITSEWSPFVYVRDSSAALQGMQRAIQLSLTPSSSEIECFWAQSPNMLGLILIVPLVASACVMLLIRFIILLQWMLFSLMLSGSFVLDAVPVIDKQKTKNKIKND